MPKRQMQDMIPPERRSIRDIAISRNGKNSSREEETPQASEEEVVEEIVAQEEETNHLPPQPPLIPKRKQRWWMWGVGIVAIILIAFFGLSVAFSGARVNVTPRQEAILIDAQFRAERNPDAGVLGFEVMTLTKEQSKIVSATGEEFVDQKASGTIIVYNDYSDQDQRLIKNTRFETPEGLIFRINESIVVPGHEEDENGNTVPGSIEAVVFADTSGEEYNISLTDFTVPGFEGEPQFDHFYARSKTPMTGGFAGLQKTVSDADETVARTELQSQLRSSILEEAREQVPEGFVLYEDASFTMFSELPNQSTDNEGEVAVREQATFHGLIFNEQELAREVALNTVATYEGETVELLNVNDLSVELVDKDLIEPVSVETIDFVITGNDILVWLFDGARLKEDLSGKHRNDIDTVLSGYPSIEEAEISLRPFWKRNFPSNTEDIRVERVLEEE